MDNIHQLIQWAEGRDAVRAMLLTSSRARPGAVVDALSDYDVILVVDDIRPFHTDRRWLEDFGAVLVSYWDPISIDPEFGFEQSGNVIQFADGLKIDFTLWPVALFRQIVQKNQLPAELDAGYRILADKDRLTVGMPPPSYRAFIPSVPDETTFLTTVEDFFSDAPYVAKCLWRGELLPAKWCLDFDMKHIFLRRMLEWRLELDAGWSEPVDLLGKGLKKKLPPEIWSQLEATYTGAALEENWDALLKTMKLFQTVAVTVAERLGFAYPHRLDQGVTDYVQKIKQMERQTGT